MSSAKLRARTGWRERLPTFSAGIAEYRLAYEASLELGDAARGSSR